MSLLGGALVHLVCSRYASHPGDDHPLHIGRDEELWTRRGDPLVFHAGSFRALEAVREDGVWGSRPQWQLFCFFSS